VAQHRLAIADRGHRNPQQGRELDHLRRGLLRQPGAHDLVPLLEPHQAARELGELLVLPQVRAFDHEQEIRELLSRVGAEPDVAVGGRLDGRRLHHRRQEGVLRVGGASVHQPVHRVREVREDQVRGLQQRQIDVLALPRLARADHGGQRCHGAVAAGPPLADATAGLEGLVAHQAPHADRPRLGLKRELGGPAPGPGAGEAVGRDREHHQGRLGGAQPGDVEALPVVGLQAVGLDHEVGAGQERSDVGFGGGPHHRLLAGIQEGEERGVAVSQVGARRRPAAQRVAFPRLHLDDLGARVEEQLRAVGPRDLGGEVEDANSGEALFHDATPTGPLAYESRTWISFTATSTGL
jgi:hypothetical protein